MPEKSWYHKGKKSGTRWMPDIKNVGRLGGLECTLTVLTEDGVEMVDVPVTDLGVWIDGHHSRRVDEVIDAHVSPPGCEGRPPLLIASTCVPVFEVRGDSLEDERR